MSVRKNPKTAKWIVNKLHSLKLEDKLELCLKSGKAFRAIEQAPFEALLRTTVA